MNRFNEHLFGIRRNSKSMMIVGEGAMKRMERLHSKSQKFGVEPVSHFTAKPLISPESPTCMTEQRHINHLTAAAVSQSYSGASARDTHQLWLKGWNQHVKRPNVRETGSDEGKVCVCVECRAREKSRAATVHLGILEHRGNIEAGDGLWRLFCSWWNIHPPSNMSISLNKCTLWKNSFHRTVAI